MLPVFVEVVPRGIHAQQKVSVLNLPTRVWALPRLARFPEMVPRQFSGKARARAFRLRAPNAVEATIASQRVAHSLSNSQVYLCSDHQPRNSTSRKQQCRFVSERPRLRDIFEKEVSEAAVMRWDCVAVFGERGRGKNQLYIIL